MWIVGTTAFVSSVREWLTGANEPLMKKNKRTYTDELRPYYDPALFKGAQRGKYYKQAIEGTNLVLIEPDLYKIFRSDEAINNALRGLVASRRRRAASRHRTLGKRRRASQ